MLKTIFKIPTEKTHIQILRYAVAGAMAFSVDFSVLYFLTDYFSLNYLLSAPVGFTAGMLVSYFLDAYWVFSARTLKNRKVEFLVFFLMNMVGLGINELVIWLVTEYCKAYYLISKIVASFFVYIWNFYSRKYILFNPRPFFRLGTDSRLFDKRDS